MKIIMHSIAAGPDYSYQPSASPIEVEDARARAFIAAGYAKSAEPIPAIIEAPPAPARRKRQIETAVAPAAPEVAALSTERTE